MADQDLESLIAAEEQIIEITKRFGLNPFPVFFELVTSYKMYEDAAYGLPGRFNHWTRGKAFYRMKTQYDYGLSKIYEVVFNTNPAVAYLMEQNDLLQNKVVIAHVMGHSDFFRNNAYFQHTSRRMIDKVGIHADRISKYEFDHGTQEVERFLDAVLSIEEHIDPNAFSRKTRDKKPDEEKSGTVGPYDDLWDLDGRKRASDDDEEEFFRKPRRFPPEPVKDILLFLAEHAPDLEDWQRDIILIVREEMLYFLPQMQTKTINEGWACLTGDSLVLTEQGLMYYHALHKRLAAGEILSVGSGSGERDRITDRHIRHNAPTIKLYTRRGLVIEGAEEHKLNIGADQWIALKDVAVGQKIPLSVGDNIWPEELVQVAAPMRVKSVSVEDVALAAGVGVHTVYRWLEGKTNYGAERITAAIEAMGYQFGHKGKPIHAKRLPLVAPTHLTEEFAEFLGCLIGDGNIHVSKGAIGYTTGDRVLADRYAALVTQLFAVEPVLFWDDKTANGKGGRWRVVFYARNVLDLLHSMGIDLKAKARNKRIPAAVLRSPKRVVSAFLRAYFDCDGCASLTSGVILSTFSDEIALALQIVLLNYGILSGRHGPNIHICGKSAEVFEREIGFGLPRKQEKLHTYVINRRWFRREEPTDEVVRVEHGVADVYDITVDRSHRYVANGMLHHNSFWHARIMREMDLDDSEATQFAQMHSGVLAPSRTHLNPYHLGYKILEDIEQRWDHPTAEERERLGRKPGQGRAKLFEVREMENDVSLLRNYLTKELIEELDLYIYKKEGDQWVIVEKDWRKVRDSIVAGMTNFGYPYLMIEDADYRRNSELYIKHYFEGQELDLNYGEKTLQYVYQLWGRPVHLETLYDGRRLLLSYDGEKNHRMNLDKERG